MHIPGLTVYVDQQPEACVDALLEAGLTHGQQALATFEHLTMKVANGGQHAVVTGGINAPFFCPLRDPRYKVMLVGISGGGGEFKFPKGVILSNKLLRAMPAVNAVDFTMADVLVRADDYYVIDLHQDTRFSWITPDGKQGERIPAIA